MADFEGSIHASGFSLNPEASIMDLGGFFLSNAFQCSANFLLNSESSFLE